MRADKQGSARAQGRPPAGIGGTSKKVIVKAMHTPRDAEYQNLNSDTWPSEGGVRGREEERPVRSEVARAAGSGEMVCWAPRVPAVAPLLARASGQ